MYSQPRNRRQSLVGPESTDRCYQWNLCFWKASNPVIYNTTPAHLGTHLVFLDWSWLWTCPPQSSIGGGFENIWGFRISLDSYCASNGSRLTRRTQIQWALWVCYSYKAPRESKTSESVGFNASSREWLLWKLASICEIHNTIGETRMAKVPSVTLRVEESLSGRYIYDIPLPSIPLNRTRFHCRCSSR